MGLLDVYNIFAFGVFLISVFLIAGKLLWRLLSLMFFKIPVPTLLKRDLFLFWSIVTYVGTGFAALITGVQGLGREPLWVIPRGAFILGALVYWAWVEYHLEDN